jgi:hypothetical protein
VGRCEPTVDGGAEDDCPRPDGAGVEWLFVGESALLVSPATGCEECPRVGARSCVDFEARGFRFAMDDAGWGCRDLL